jgi:hypothetical protein
MWEYKVMNLDPNASEHDIQADLDGAGRQGWELVSVTRYRCAQFTCFFKRPKSAK